MKDWRYSIAGFYSQYDSLDKLIREHHITGPCRVDVFSADGKYIKTIQLLIDTVGCYKEKPV